MREVEVKARIGDRNQATTTLRERGALLIGTKHQTDRVFVPLPYRHLNEVDAHKTPVLRIREEDDRAILTLKRDISDQLDSVEYEVVVNNADVAVKILEQLGCHLAVEVSKIRQTWQLNGDVLVCVDEVEDLGAFIELESLVPDDRAVDSVRDSLWGILLSLGVAREDEVREGYDRMLENRQLS